ncbi:MAG: hypothetical protein WCJ14_02815 [Verrucomicrobiota bacterium]
MTHRPFSRFMRWFTALLGTYLALAATLTTTVDPWRINGAPWAMDSLDKSREISKARRVGKAALANRGTWQAVILGSSRIEIGLDPTHPALPQPRTVNLAMSGATLYETVATGNYAMDRNPQLKTLIFGLDPGDLHNDADSRASNQYYQSPLADNNRSLERRISQIVGWRAFAESIATLRRYSKGIRPIFGPLGQMCQPEVHENLRTFVESMPFENQVDQWNLRAQILRQQKAQLLARFIARVRQAGIEMFLVIPPQHALKQIHPTADRPDIMGWEIDLRALVDICRLANTATNGPPVQLWSFLTFNAYTTTPMPVPGAPCQAMPSWCDLGHSSNELGNRVLDTLFAGRPGAATVPDSANLTSFREHGGQKIPPEGGTTYLPMNADSSVGSPAFRRTLSSQISPKLAPFTTAPGPVGVNLLAGDWKAIRSAWIEDHRQYCLSHPLDVAWWRELAARRRSNKQS